MKKLIAAAKRLRAKDYKPKREDFVNNLTVDLRRMKDNSLLAQAWLADFQDKDLDPITDEWLEKIGFEKHPAMLILTIQGDELVRHKTSWWLGSLRLQNFQLRGDLRKFLKYLGIEVKS